MRALARWLVPFGVIAGAIFFLRSRPRCWWGGPHNVGKHVSTGGFVCRACGLTGAVLSDLGFDAAADYVRLQHAASGER